MKKKTLLFAKMFWLVAGGLVAHLADAQDVPSKEEAAMLALPSAPADLTPSDSAPPGRMLHHWHHVASLAHDQKSLNELLVEHPELQTHSHMTYYSSPIQVGERTRLQPPGSEFSH